MKKNQKTPETLLVIPMKNHVTFPVEEDVIPIRLTEALGYEIEELIEENHFVVLANMTRQNLSGSDGNFYEYATYAKIIKTETEFEEGPTDALWVAGISRVKIISTTDQNETIILADIEYLEEIIDETKADELSSLHNETIGLMNEFIAVLKNAQQLDHINNFLQMMENYSPGKLADAITSRLPIINKEKQKILETLDVAKKVKILNEHLADHVSTTKKNYSKQGIGDSENEVVATGYELMLEEADVSPQSKKVIKEQLTKLSFMAARSNEADTCRDYIDWLFKLPYKNKTPDNHSIKHARKILDKEHAGLDKVKDRITEFLAVKKLNPNLRSDSLCLVGPPGVGKTSIAHSVANALGRKLFRFSVGGMKEEAEIKGHRRTFISALPGQIAKALVECGTTNPVIVIDEIDKIGSGHNGDPSSALLEVLDSKQNNKFKDTYLDVEMDLSDVLFITTANTENIPSALLDRMQVIHLNTYTREEKFHIAVNHLVPQQIEANGLKRRGVKFTDEAIKFIIAHYTREAGVRNLKREIGDVCRKLASKIVKKEASKTDRTIKPKQVEELIGREKFSNTALIKNPKPGIVAGLAYTQSGGDVLYIESVYTPGKADIVTGQLGDVMEESELVARTAVSNYLSEKSSTKKENRKSIHIHVPDGSTPKDGPSAGITMATAIYSLLSDKPIPSNLAMTGELTVSGRVTAVGGIKEKVLSAYNLGIKKIILPLDNEKDLDEIPENIRSQINFVPVTSLGEVFDNVNS